jgi:hypothetical protein
MRISTISVVKEELPEFRNDSSFGAVSEEYKDTEPANFLLRFKGSFASAVGKSSASDSVKNTYYGLIEKLDMKAVGEWIRKGWLIEEEK